MIHLRDFLILTEFGKFASSAWVPKKLNYLYHKVKNNTKTRIFYKRKQFRRIASNIISYIHLGYLSKSFICFVNWIIVGRKSHQNKFLMLLFPLKGSFYYFGLLFIWCNSFNTPTYVSVWISKGRSQSLGASLTRCDHPQSDHWS